MVFLLIHRVILGVFLDNRMLINVLKSYYEKFQTYAKLWEYNIWTAINPLPRFINYQDFANISFI